MNDLARRVQRVYLTLQLGNTLAASFIWGISTLFLLDAGLSNLDAFAANAFFTVAWSSATSRPVWSRMSGAGGLAAGAGKTIVAPPPAPLQHDRERVPPARREL